MVNSLRRGEIWWADLGNPAGSDPGYRRPVLIVQDDHFNQSNLATVIVLSLTSNIRYQELPGNVYLSKEHSGLPQNSVVNVSQITSVDKVWLDEFVAELPATIMAQIDDGLSLILGL